MGPVLPVLVGICGRWGGQCRWAKEPPSSGLSGARYLCCILPCLVPRIRVKSEAQPKGTKQPSCHGMTSLLPFLIFVCAPPHLCHLLTPSDLICLPSAHVHLPSATSAPTPRCTHVSQLATGCVTRHTSHACVTHFRPILGNLV